METRFRQFHDYQFAADEVFQRGLAQLGEAVRRSEERLLEAKIYYYSRFIRPIDLESYKEWLSSQIIDANNQNNLAAEEDITKAFKMLFRHIPSDPGQNDQSATVETTKASHMPLTDQQEEKMEDARVYFQIRKEIEGTDHNAPLKENSQTQERPENRTVGIGNLSSITTEVNVERCTLSFSQVLHLVQSGQEIPGIQKRNIMSTNSLPTVSQMTRKSKPWESV
ncbi:uncharacterized protein LOC119969600 [Scyliorhinus canicula]|uniref:uncharacterized protein LOC119969600 n=1 Tax=Scyliorhinus canicula TaxID=7830 RepID=UPI0018F74EA0|nr:uncharacterized protein LOC119969600 [Scyliorhinus canicula]